MSRRAKAGLAAGLVVLIAAVAIGIAAAIGSGGGGSKDAVDPPTAPASAPVPPKTYDFRTVSIPGASSEVVTGVLDPTVFAGDATVDGVRYGFVDRAGHATRFSLPFAGRKPGVQVAGVDAAGEVVGDYLAADGYIHGFARSAAGAFRRIDVAAGVHGTSVNGVTPGGVIFGSYTTAAGATVGFVESGSQVTILRVKVGSAYPPVHVEFDRNGTFGGYYVLDKVGHGFFDQDGIVHTVDDPAVAGRAGRVTVLYAEGASGVYFGSATLSSTKLASFQYFQGAFRNLQDPQEQAGLGGTVVFAANAADVIGGGFGYDARGQTRGFIATPAG